MERAAWIDRLKVISIFMVLVVHSTEPFYLGGEGSYIASQSDVFWVAFFDSIARACVPLFIIASSFLLLPLKYPTATFFRKRLVRVIVPFVVWTVIYAFVWGEPVNNFRDLLLNFNYSAGHLWFVYMLIGIYLLLPLISPWTEKVSKKELSFYLIVCFVTTFIPFIRTLCGGEMPVVYGSSGIPNPAKFPLWGEASWNAYGVFYYFSGFIGYILFSLYVKRFVKELSWKRTLIIGVCPLIIGFTVCFWGFVHLVAVSTGNQFPAEGAVSLAVLWETPWFYDGVGVALMAIGWTFIYRKLNSSGNIYSKLTLPLAKASYGVYLCHMVILVEVFAALSGVLEGKLGMWRTPVEIIATAVITFIVATIASLLLQRIPRIGKYLVG